MKMKLIKKIAFYVLIGLSILGILVFTFGIINTMVSLKYETNNPTDCISLVNGDDLCFAVKVLKGLVITCFVTLILLIVFRRQFLK
jgi:hypothetical protein